jgi:hypothetical protein
MTADSTPPTPAPRATAEERHRGWFHRAVDAIDERMGIKALTYPVPEHANNLAWSLGGITVAAFVARGARGGGSWRRPSRRRSPRPGCRSVGRGSGEEGGRPR